MDGMNADEQSSHITMIAFLQWASKTQFFLSH